MPAERVSGIYQGARVEIYFVTSAIDPLSETWCRTYFADHLTNITYTVLTNDEYYATLGNRGDMVTINDMDGFYLTPEQNEAYHD